MLRKNRNLCFSLHSDCIYVKASNWADANINMNNFYDSFGITEDKNLSNNIYFVLTAKVIKISKLKNNRMTFENFAASSSSNPSANVEKIPKLSSSSSDKSMEHKIKIVGLAIFLRIFSAQYFTEFANQLPLFSTPWNSLKRFKEGVFLLDSGQSIYDGDLFHVLPMFVHVIRPILNFTHLLRLEWTLLDLFCAYFLAKFVEEYIRLRCANLAKQKEELEKTKWLSTLAFASYLLNPMSIGCWTVLSLSAIVNALVSASLYFMITGNLFLAILTLSMAVQLNPYYIILFAPIFVQFQTHIIFSIFLSICLVLLLFASNFLLLEENPSDLFRNTIGFFLNVPDLTPNNGIFWYFFTQVFEHYRLLFLCVFQLNAIIYVMPLSTLIRKNPALLVSVLLITVSLFSPYPSYAETALYLPTLAAFFDLHKFLRQKLVTGCTLLATFVLSLIMWAMWVTIGSGNANFFFAIVWVFNLAQIFISADLVSSFLRAELARENGGETEVEEKFEGVRLMNISPF